MASRKKQNWWYGDRNNNRLQDLPTHFILLFLMRHKGARNDFQAAYDALTDEDRKEVIVDLIESNPGVKNNMWIDEREWHDRLQHRQVTGGKE